MRLRPHSLTTTLFVIAVSLLSRVELATACTYYAAPQAVGLADGSSEANAFLIDDFWDVVVPGESLCLTDGHYIGADSMIRPPAGLKGEPNARIHVLAINEGSVLIDGREHVNGQWTGNWTGRPIHLIRNDYFTIEGVNAANSSTAVVAIKGTNPKDENGNAVGGHPPDPIIGVRINRVVAWNAFPENTSAHVISVEYAQDTILEDVAAFGTGRKMIQVFRSRDTRITRAFARWDGYHSGNGFPVSCAYRSYDTYCDNVIAVASGLNGIPLGADSRGALAMDGVSPADAPHISNHESINLTVSGSLGWVIGPSSQSTNNELRTGTGAWFANVQDVALQDVVALMDRDDQHPITSAERRPVFLGDCLGAGCTQSTSGLSANRLTTIGGSAGPSIDADWTVTDHADFALTAPRPDVFTGNDGGAELCFEYEAGAIREDANGVPIGLWPWRMGTRIDSATASADGTQWHDGTSLITLSSDRWFMRDEIEDAFDRSVPVACKR